MIRFDLRKPLAYGARGLALASLASLFAAGCLFETDSRRAGTGSQGGNAIVVGRVFLPGGAPATAAEVILRRADYLAYPSATLPGTPDGKDIVADANGRFRLTGLKRGAYVLTVRKDSLGLTLPCEVPSDNGEVTLAPDSLSRLGNIQGTLVLPGETAVPAFVQIFGQERRVQADPVTGRFLFPDVPKAEVRIRAYATEGGLISAESPLTVRGQGLTDTLTLSLKASRALVFGFRSAGLVVQGVGADNPIIYDNNEFARSLDDEYLWAKASLGANLVGIIASRNLSNDTGNHSTLAGNLAAAIASVATARNSGIKGLPDPVAGTNSILTPAPGGGALDFIAEDNAGSRLIIAEALKASPEKPLVVIAEGQPTTVANALLLDSSIADRIVVLGYEFGRANLSPEAFLIAKRCRYLNCDLRWKDEFPEAAPATLPRNPMGDSLRAHWLQVRPGPAARWGSVSALVWLFNQATWRGAQPMSTPASDKFQAATLSDMDFLHIGDVNVDKAAQAAELIRTLADPKAYGK